MHGGCLGHRVLLVFDSFEDLTLLLWDSRLSVLCLQGCCSARLRVSTEFTLAALPPTAGDLLSSFMLRSETPSVVGCFTRAVGVCHAGRSGLRALAGGVREAGNGDTEPPLAF